MDRIKTASRVHNSKKIDEIVWSSRSGGFSGRERRLKDSHSELDQPTKQQQEEEETPQPLSNTFRVPMSMASQLGQLLHQHDDDPYFQGLVRPQTGLGSPRTR